MDGILADIYDLLIERLNKKHQFNHTYEERHTLFGDHKILVPHITDEMMFSVFNEKDFFLKIPPIPGAIDAVRELQEHSKIYIVTTPWYGNAYSFIHKIQWIEAYLPGLERKVLLTKSKEAVYGDIFIDDTTKNLMKWKEAWPTKKTASLEYPWTNPACTDIIAPNWKELQAKLMKEIYD